MLTPTRTTPPAKNVAKSSPSSAGGTKKRMSSSSGGSGAESGGKTGVEVGKRQKEKKNNYSGNQEIEFKTTEMDNWT